MKRQRHTGFHNRPEGFQGVGLAPAWAWGVVLGVVVLVSGLAGASAEHERSGGARWGKNYFPNVPLVTHEGETVRFFDDLLRDKIVVINFIYTTCTDVCPLDTSRLKSVQKILGDRVGRDVFFYSISIDPERDTPEVLAGYRERFGIGPGWTFLVGNEEDTILLRKKLGLYIEGLEEKLDHNMSFVIGNQRTGRWMQRSPMDNPQFIAEQIGSWLTNWAEPSDLLLGDYAHAPMIDPPSMGENLFRTRCMSCHTIGSSEATRRVGGTAGREREIARLGPDLLWVTEKRDRKWLARWLADPEGMILEQDPIALELYEEYGRTVMPNLQLNEVEVNALIEYMATESRRVREASTAAAPDASAVRERADHQHHH